MRYVVWDAEMGTRDEKGRTERAAVAVRAKNGAAWAIERLKGPRFPKRLSYLYDLFLRLRRGLRRDDMNGHRVCTWVDLAAFERETPLRPHEEDAMFLLVDASEHPEAFAERATDGG